MVGSTQGGDDHISDLPKDLVGVILSLLPIKDTMRTSVLSKDWKFNWTLISNCDVDIDARRFLSVPSRDKIVIFVNFVGKIIHHLPKIKSFHLKVSDCGGFVRRFFNLWIYAVLSRKVESLHITMSPYGHPSETFKVVMLCTSKVIAHNPFENLVTLNLHHVTIFNRLASSNTMKFSFPVLREILLVRCIWSGMEVVEMHAPSLRIYETIASTTGVDAYSIKIVGSMLEKLLTRSGPLENFILDNSTVEYAYVHCCNPNEFALEDHGLKIRQHLRELSSVNTLVLEGFLEAIAETQGPQLQLFPKMEKLHVTDPIDVDGLIELLHATPYLKSLIIDFRDENEEDDEDDEGDDDEDDDYDYDATDEDDDYDYDAVDEDDDYDYDAVDVPMCLFNHLENVMFDYSNCDPHFELAEFLLGNGHRLKNVSAYGPDHIPTDGILRLLSTFPKASPDLIIEGSPCSACELL